MIDRTNKGERIKPANHTPSFTPWVGTEQVATVVIDGRVWLATAIESGATVTEFASIGLCHKDGHGTDRDVLRLPLTDWDELVRQVEQLRSDPRSD